MPYIPPQNIAPISKQLKALKQMLPSKKISPNLQKIEMVEPVSKVNMQKSSLAIPMRDLESMGIRLSNQPKGAATKKYTSEVFNKIYKKGKPFGLNIKYAGDHFDYYNPLLDSGKYTSSDKFGGAYHAADKTIEIMEDADPNLYKFRLAHELGHHLGLGATLEDEYIAEAFAHKYFPGTYFYKNNPYIKESWEPGYVPPKPLPTLKFPNY